MRASFGLIHSIDDLVRRHATYKADTGLRDSWTSYAKQVLVGQDFEGDCDDWAQTSLEVLVRKGVDKSSLYRALVSSTGTDEVDHMIGLVQVDSGQWYCIGDTFGPPELVTGERVRCHRILQVSRIGEFKVGRGVWRFWGAAKRSRVTNTAVRGQRCSEQGVNLIRSHEQLRTTPYDDNRPHRVLKPGDKVVGELTVGYGHTGPDVKIGVEISAAKATQLLKVDLAEAERAICKLVLVPITQPQFDALCSFVFNVGESQFSSSTLLKKINAKAPAHEIQAQFRRWNKDNGKVLNGLIARREDECALWVGRPVEARVDAPGLVTTKVEPVAVVEETKKVHKSFDVWALVSTMSAGVLGSLSEAVREFRESIDLPLIGAAAGVIIAIISGLLLYKRLREILVEARQ